MKIDKKNQGSLNARRLYNNIRNVKTMGNSVEIFINRLT